jgi:hypothetical protein
MKAKKARPAKKLKRSRRSAAAPPSHATRTLIQMSKLRSAAAIVGQVLVHFGAGTGMGAQIFASPHVMKRFTSLLLTSTMANYDVLNWDTDAATRDTVCQTAQKHGRLAKQWSGGRRLTWDVIYETLQIVKQDCPGGAGGGLVCVD